MSVRNVLQCAALGLMMAGFAAATSVQAAPADDAKALAEKAVLLVKTEGEQAFSKLSDPKGEYVQGSLYVTVIDKQGVIHANINPKVVGVNMWEAADPDGTKFTQLAWKSTENAETAWIDYKFVNPESKKIEQKRAWVHRVGDYVVQAGYYVTQ